MTLTTRQSLIIILVISFVTLLTRAVPFIFFPSKKKTPEFLAYLSGTLPLAVIGMLVIYCLKGTSVISYPFGLPELLSVAAVAAVHLWKKNTLLSIGGGTVIYMLLVQFVFR